MFSNRQDIAHDNVLHTPTLRISDSYILYRGGREGILHLKVKILRLCLDRLIHYVPTFRLWHFNPPPPPPPIHE